MAKTRAEVKALISETKVQGKFKTIVDNRLKREEEARAEANRIPWVDPSLVVPT